ncbi:MAG: tetratricopeptide repeat protein [Proteobacteria bacterium]|nr:tetratricopeptide repeat protein [Pseudomonadota bacterium]
MIRYFLSVITIIIILYVPAAKAANDPDTLYKQGKFTEAQKAYAEADMNHPKDIRFRYNRGCAAYKNSDYKAATAAFSSVLKRTTDKETKFKVLYNLGNTAFKQKDYKSAASYYKQAIISNPGNEDAAYNMELSLIYLEKQKKNKNDQKREPPKDSQNKEDKQGQSGENKNDKNKNQKASDKKSTDSKENKNNKDESEKHKEAENNKVKNENPGNNNKQEESKNLSKDLSRRPDPSQQRPQQKEDMTPEKAGAMLDKKKANDLLDSVRENRSLKAFGNKGNMRLGKDW